MPAITHRLCTLCGVERPIETFERTGQGPYRKTCSLDHGGETDLRSRLQKSQKAERRRIRRASRRADKSSEVMQAQYDRARNRGPRRVTQLKASRMPLGVPIGMTANDYAIYLTGPHWISFRDEYRSRYDFTCFVCSGAADDLHHITYDRVGCERVEDVTPLCRAHHREVHDAVKGGVPLGAAHYFVKGKRG